MITKYGIQFEDDTPPATMALAAYSYNIARNLDRNLRADLMLDAMRNLWPEKTYKINSWTVRRVKKFCTEPTGFFTMWGPSSAGKSTDVAAIVLTHWLSAPDITTCTVCSTTRPMLVQRIFGEIVRLYLALEDPPGEYQSSKTHIVLGDENTKNGIFGVAILMGTIKDAMGNIIGKHNRRNVLVIDEMQATREAAVEAVSNLQGGEDFHFIGIGNPESRLDPLGRYSEPVGGWNSISPADEEWQTKWGSCIFFDGRKSPAIVEPDGALKYPYLLKQSDIDLRIKWYTENSPRFWSQTIGFIPPEGLIRSLFSESFFVKYDMMRKVTWQKGYEVFAALDPSYASGGDRCILTLAHAGIDTAGQYVIEFQEPINIPLEMSPEEPMSYSTARKVKEQCTAAGITPVNFAIDISATQTVMADIIESEWGRGIYRVQFGGRPTALAVSTEDKTPANQAYSNRVTELWHTFYQFGRHGHIAGVQAEAVKEFCSRLLLEKLQPQCLEPKTAMKARTGKSPDIADSHVILTAIIRERLGITPGTGEKQEISHEDLNGNLELDKPGETYLTTPEQSAYDAMYQGESIM